MDPHEVFRHLPRDERAAYVRSMRKTFAVAGRDFGRVQARESRKLSASIHESVLYRHSPPFRAIVRFMGWLLG